jgi:LysM repeat protein
MEWWSSGVLEIPYSSTPSVLPVIARRFHLEVGTARIYCRTMKPISLLMVIAALGTPLCSQAQDAATQERLDKLAGQIENLIEAQRVQQKHIDALAKEIESLRDQASKPTGNYASQDDLKRLADALKDVDRKRMEDAEKVSSQLAKLGKTLTATPPPPKKNSGSTTDVSTTEKPPKDEKGYPYTIQAGDTLSAIVQAYRDKNIKVSTDQILKANPGLKAESLKVGQKIWIPAPQT